MVLPSTARIGTFLIPRSPVSIRGGSSTIASVRWRISNPGWTGSSTFLRRCSTRSCAGFRHSGWKTTATSWSACLNCCCAAAGGSPNFSATAGRLRATRSPTGSDDRLLDSQGRVRGQQYAVAIMTKCGQNRGSFNPADHRDAALDAWPETVPAFHGVYPSQRRDKARCAGLDAPDHTLVDRALEPHAFGGGARDE